VGRFAYSILIWLLLMALLPMLWGWRPTVVSSGSMAPAIRTGDVLLSGADDGTDLGPGTVILYEDPVRGDVVAHRIRSVTEDGLYITRGDSNPGNDSTPVDPSQVEAVGQMLVPYVGLPAHWLRTANWLGVALFILGVATAVWLGHRNHLRSIWERRRDWGPRFNRRRMAAAGLAVLVVGAAAAPVMAAFSDTTTNGVSSFVSGTWADVVGTAVWQEGGRTRPEAAVWDGSSFEATGDTVSVGEYRIMQGAVAPGRDEAIVVGVDEGEDISGEIWDGTTWSALPFTMDAVTESFWWGMGVAYESQSGDAMVVWNNGTTGTSGLSYRVWNGTSWSSENTITTPQAGEPKQLRVAADPDTDEMVLVASNATSRDYAIVWNGSSWGNSITVDSAGGDDRTDVFVAYEQQSGDAFIVYGRNASTLYSRTWNGSVWSGEAPLAVPGGASGDVRWTVLGADPLSDQIAVGVLTRDSDIWLAIWTGSGWGATSVATTAAPTQTSPAVGVAFDGSGQALAVYGESTSVVRYRTWAGSTWSIEQSGPNVGGTPNSMVLYPSGSDDIMLAAQDGGSDLNYVLWDGSAWDSPNEQETNTGEIKNQPFTFLWGVEATAVTGSGSWTSFFGGEKHGCAVHTDGTLRCWGHNNEGQLGDGTTNDSSTPVQTLGPGGVGFFTGAAEMAADSLTAVQVVGSGGVGFLGGASKITAGDIHTCVAKDDGTVWCWGENNEGMLGDGTTTNSDYPVQVVGPGGVGVLTGAADVTAGLKFSCALKSDGTVWCWGKNNEGQLGDGSGTDSETPVQVEVSGGSALTGVVDLEGGDEHTCAVKSDGTAWCWGRNDKGQVGDGTTNGRDYAVQVVGSGGVGFLTGVGEVAAGRKHSCATLTIGSAWCWGENNEGQLGDNSKNNSDTPVQVVGPGGVGFLANAGTPAASELHSCVVVGGDEMWCWGKNDKGQLGDGTTNNSLVPVQVTGV
jgi:signal peptidase I